MLSPSRHKIDPETSLEFIGTEPYITSVATERCTPVHYKGQVRFYIECWVVSCYRVSVTPCLRTTAAPNLQRVIASSSWSNAAIRCTLFSRCKRAWRLQLQSCVRSFIVKFFLYADVRPRFIRLIIVIVFDCQWLVID